MIYSTCDIENEFFFLYNAISMVIYEERGRERETEKEAERYKARNMMSDILYKYYNLRCILNSRR